MRVAAIDIGTVTSRLMVADVDEHGVHQVLRESRITNLGEGVDATGELSAAAIDRTAAAVAGFKAKIDACASDAPVQKIIALATSASRDARNAAVFQARLRDLGIELSVIDGSLEARLSFLGAANDFRGRDLLFCDIGGGSTELVLGRAEGDVNAVVPQVVIEDAHSFNIGCRRLTERFFKSDPPSKLEFEEARAFARETLSPFFQVKRSCESLVAVAGVPTTVVAVRDKLVPYDSSKVHGAFVSREQFMQVGTEICTTNLQQRMKIEGLQPQRAAIFPAGIVIMDAVMELAGMNGFIACESDILVGMVLNAAANL